LPSKQNNNRLRHVSITQAEMWFKGCGDSYPPRETTVFFRGLFLLPSNSHGKGHEAPVSGRFKTSSWRCPSW